MTASDPSAAADPMRRAAGDLRDEREWLLTDGRGGYACGTAADLPTRRYHAWLTAMGAGGRRWRWLAGADERLVARGGEAPLSPWHWQGQPQPSLPDAQRTFRSDPVPTWTARMGDAVVERSLAMPRGGAGAAILVRWRNVGSAPVRLRVRPLLADEDADALLRERAVDGASARQDGAVSFRPSGAGPALWLSFDGGAAFHADPVGAEPCWYRGVFFAVDAERGYDAVGDRYAPGVLQLDLAPGAAATAAFAVGAPVAAPATAFDRAVEARAQRARQAEAAPDPLAARLRRGVDDFFFRDQAGRLSVLAGFPWFSEWGRDAFVALPGLTLAAGQPERCTEVLAGALPFLRGGLLPNVYGDAPSTSHYDSADAALWFALAVQRLQDAGASRDAVRSEFGPALRSMAEAYLQGTELGLRTDADGLLCAGSAEANATWMDARTAAGPVTPRHGQPVEIAALWCALLQHLGELYGEPWSLRAQATGSAFVRAFWRADAQCLFDRRHDGTGDPAVRPNMVVAAALRRSPLQQAQRRGIVAIAARELRTPRGLRTLAPGDAAYRGRYGGGPEARDSAYHQGTVWPWLAGFFVEASLRAAAPAELREERARQRRWLEGFLPEIDRAGIDHLSEVFDGDAPQRPGGTFAQAWNTGELLRALLLCQGAAEAVP